MLLSLSPVLCMALSIRQGLSGASGLYSCQTLWQEWHGNGTGFGDVFPLSRVEQSCWILTKKTFKPDCEFPVWYCFTNRELLLINRHVVLHTHLIENWEPIHMSLTPTRKIRVRMSQPTIVPRSTHEQLNKCPRVVALSHYYFLFLFFFSPQFSFFAFLRFLSSLKLFFLSSFSYTLLQNSHDLDSY